MSLYLQNDQEYSSIRACILTVLSCVMFGGYMNDNKNVMMYALFLLFALIFYYGLKNPTKHIAYLVFLVSFYTFLMGRVTLGVFIDTTLIHSLLGSGDFSRHAEYHIYISLFIALLFFYIGYISNKKNYDNRPLKITDEDYSVRKIRKITKRLLWLTAPFVFLDYAEKISFVTANGYANYYLDYQSRLPYIVSILSFSFEYILLFFLATMPSKQEAKIPICIYIFVAIVSLGTGQRGSFVLSILLIITYLFLRNRIQPNEEKWIKKKHVIFLLLLLPFFLSFLFMMAYVRTDRDSETTFNFLLSFLYQQGVSVEVIGYGYDYVKSFPEGRFYLFGDFIDYFRHNFIAQALWNTPPVEPQSVTHALNDYAYDATLTYHVKSYDYLHGVGLGSCYIAEAWHDLGYFGIGLVSFIYGRVISLIPKWCKDSVWKSSAALIMFINIIYAPRSRADKFLYAFMSFVVISIYLYLYYESRRSKSKANL